MQQFATTVTTTKFVQHQTCVSVETAGGERTATKVIYNVFGLSLYMHSQFFLTFINLSMQKLLRETLHEQV